MENENKIDPSNDEKAELVQPEQEQVEPNTSTVQIETTTELSSDSTESPTKDSKQPAQEDKTSESSNKSRYSDYCVRLENSPILQFTQSPIQKSVTGSTDPTQPFEPFNPGLQWLKYLHIEAESSKWLDRLIEEGLLIISCAHEPLLRTASMTIISDDRLQLYKRRTIDLDHDEDARGLSLLLDAKSLPCIGESEPGKNDGGQHCVVIVDICETVGMTNFEEYGRRFARNRFWRNNNLLYLFRISGSALTMASKKGFTGFFHDLPVWYMDALPEILEDYKDEGNITSIQNALARSRSAGLWSSEESDFLRDVEGSLQGGLKALEDEIQKRREAQTDEQPPAKAKDLLRSANSIEKAALFAAVFFPESSPHQFTLVLELLLDGEQIEDSSQEEIVNSETGQVTIRNVRRQVKALEWWESHQEDSIDRLGLEFSAHAQGKTVIQFTRPAMRTAVREAFYPPAVIRYFDRLHSAGVLFDPRTPKTLVDSLVSLTAEMSIRHYDVYNETWLMERLFEIVGRIKEYAHQANQVLNIVAEPKTLGSVFELVEKEWHYYHSLLFSRLTVLCRGFLNDVRSARVTNAFLDQLIARTQPNGLAVLEILKRLRAVPDFDRFQRLHHLLNVGNVETCQKVVQVLIDEMQDSPGMYWKVLKTVIGWHPHIDILEKKKLLSSSHCWSLAFLYITYVVTRDAHEQYRKNRLDMPISPLFAQLDELPPLDERLSILGKWLAHPAFPQSIEIILEKDNPELYQIIKGLALDASIGEFCIAEMLEFWNWEVSENAIDELAPLLSKALSRNFLLHLRLIIRMHFNWLADAIRNTRDSKFCAILKSRRKKADELSRKLVPSITD